MNIETRTEDGVKIVKLTGRLCLGSALDRFNSTMTELIDQSNDKIVLDLEEVPAIDSSGIGLLVRYLTTTKLTAGGIRLLKPSRFAVQTLKMVGLLNLFPIYEDLAEAVASFQ